MHRLTGKRKSMICSKKGQCDCKYLHLKAVNLSTYLIKQIITSSREAFQLCKKFNYNLLVHRFNREYLINIVYVGKQNLDV